MKIIYATTGEEIFVDDDDYPVLARFSWSLGGAGKHPMSFIYGKNDTSYTVYMHQIIMGGAVGTDHHDRNTRNMQKSNLRASTHQQNGWNRAKQRSMNGRPCTSKYKGVSRYENSSGEVWWNVTIKTTAKGVKPEKYVRRNHFKTEIEAALWYDEQIVKLRPGWAVTNILNINDSQCLSSKG